MGPGLGDRQPLERHGPKRLDQRGEREELHDALKDTRERVGGEGHPRQIIGGAIALATPWAASGLATRPAMAKPMLRKMRFATAVRTKIQATFPWTCAPNK